MERLKKLVAKFKSGKLAKVSDSCKKFLKTNEGIVLSLVIFFPLGIYLIWKYSNFSRVTKIMTTLISIILLLTFTSLDAANRNLVKANDRLNEKSAWNESKIIELTNDNTDLNKSKLAFAAYQTKMKPYESLSEADAKARQLDNQAAKKVSDQIDKLPVLVNLTLENKDQAKNIRGIFEGLTKNQKELVDLTSLIEAENQLVKLEANAKQAAEEKKKAEEEAKQAEARKQKLAEERAAEEARGYETGISYDQLARTPDDYQAKKVKFAGKVIQVMEDDDKTQIRLAVDGNYDTVLYAEYSSNLVSKRVLEDDYITISGTSAGLLSYKSTMGGTITIPSVSVKKIDQ